MVRVEVFKEPTQGTAEAITVPLYDRLGRSGGGGARMRMDGGDDEEGDDETTGKDEEGEDASIEREGRPVMRGGQQPTGQRHYPQGEGDCES